MVGTAPEYATVDRRRELVNLGEDGSPTIACPSLPHASLHRIDSADRGPRLRYHDFELSIEKGADGGIELKSWCDAHGEYHDTATLDPAALERDRQLLSADAVQHDALVALGSRLYGYTFASTGRNIEWHFGQCWGAIGNGPTGVRVRLRVEAPELAVIPWEYIYSERLRCFLGVSERTPVVRYLELPQAVVSLEAPLPVRVLIVIPDETGLDTATEQREILAALEPLRGSVAATVLAGQVTRERIALALEESEYHVFHFIGHGDFADDRAVLVLNAEGGGEDRVDHDRFADLFRNHRSLKLVVLNSCRGGQLSASKPFVGMGAALVRLGVPAVIAMQYEIADDEAICFARTLYRQLFTGRDKGRIEIAVSHARSAMAQKFPDTRAVGLPVLFMHAREGVLFDLETGSALRDLPLSARSAERMKAVIRTHEQNLELLRAESAEPAAGVERGGTRSAASGAAALERAEQGALDRARRRLRFRNASLAIAVAVALVLGLAATFFGFRAVHPWFRPESYFIAFSDLFHHHESQASVTLVVIDSTTVAALGGTPDATWRARHAAVVDRLAAAGAPVIAFNLAFAAQPPALAAATDSLRAAVVRARDRGTTVLAAADSFAGGLPGAEPALVPVMRWGPNCVDTARVTAPLMTLVSGRTRGARPPRLESLPLAAVAALHEARGEAGGGSAIAERLRRAVTLDAKIAGARDARCGLAAGDTLYRMAVDFAPRREHDEPGHRLSYLDVLRGVSLGDLAGRLVLVGFENPNVTFPIVRGLHQEERVGLEVEADAMNTVLREIRIAPLSPGRQFLVILVMAALGAAVAYQALRLGWHGQLLVLTGGIVVYFVAGALLYARDHAMLNTLFDLSALVLAFIAVKSARRIWFP